MDTKWFSELIADMAAFAPDQSWEQILKQLVDAMAACDGKLTSGELGKFIAIAAAIQRKSKGTKGWWEL